jgi:carboxylesterase
VLGLGVTLLLVTTSCRTIVDHMVTRADARATRDPDTGVLIGARARDMGPMWSDRAVLFVHGHVGAGNNFSELPERAAAAGWRTRVMRLPGHGTSPRDIEATSPDDLFEAVRSELAALNERHETVVVVGHSMGGALSTLAVSELGADGLVLAAAYFGVTDRWYYGLSPETWAEYVLPQMRWVYKGEMFMGIDDGDAASDVLSYEWVPAKAVLNLLEIGRRVNQPDVLARITCPVLALHSDHDIAASLEAMEQAVDGMAATEKEVFVLERSNHHVFMDYEREFVFERILSFLEARVTDSSR